MFANVSVPAGGTGIVFCTMSANNAARVNVIDYLP